MIIDSKFEIGDMVWVMLDNHPVECMITGMEFNSGVIGCNGTTMSIFGESFYQETTVKYYIIRKTKLKEDGKYERIYVEKIPKTITHIFATKKDLVMSLL